jgi:ketosteroid isomerase-like protein
MMKKLLLLLSFSVFVLVGVNAQSSQEKAVAAAVEQFKNAIVNADKATLDKLLLDQLVFAHSSGKVQNKTECIDEIVSLKPNDYTKVDITDQTIKVVGNTAIVRHIYAADFTSNGKNGSLKIGVMLVFQKSKGGWKLLARQAYKV